VDNVFILIYVVMLIVIFIEPLWLNQLIVVLIVMVF